MSPKEIAQYKITGKLGEGGMGAVCRGRREDLRALETSPVVQ